MDCDDLRPWPTDKDIFTVQQTPESTGPVLRQDHEPLCYFYFDPATDHITLSHKCKGPVEVVDLAAGERRGVPPRQPYATTIMERGGSGSKRKFARSVQHAQIWLDKWASRRGIYSEASRHWADEKRFLERLHHPCIVELLGADARLYALYLKVLPGKDLSQWVDTGHFFTCGSEGDANRTILRISCQMTSAVAFLHKQARIVHNDIKPANIVAHLPRGTKVVDAKLIDFGHASVVEATDCPGGTPWYMPFDGPNNQGPARDCWALGVTLLFVMRAIPLPEKTQPVWRIDQVLHDDIQAQLMRDWLAGIQDRRKELGDGDIESFVHELLSPDAEERCRYLRRLARTLPLGSLT
ncbi:hypothetical protein ACCO45_010052 [Purpureocillium lilacinum]|uniref:Uncharacterized protein n=1 Tax=Purpureocillium lilacinum TaxID=33203 RepID=A0ACC4DF82_PURLI